MKPPIRFVLKLSDLLDHDYRCNREPPIPRKLSDSERVMPENEAV